MRPTLACLVLLVGCAAPPPLLLTRAAVTDPYAPAPLGDFPAVARLHAPRVPGWGEARHRAEVAALSSVVQASFPLAHPDVAVLTGPEPASELVARYLCDRARFLGARLQLTVRRARCRADAWSFEALNPGQGALWTLVSLADADALAPGGGEPFVLADAEEATWSCRDLQSYISGCAATPSHDGSRLLLDPVIDTFETGEAVTARAWLTLGGAGLRLDWRHTSARAERDPAEALVRNASGRTRLTVSLPRVSRQEVAGRFTLRRDEALVFVQAPPGDDDLLLTVITWDAVAIP